MSSEIDSINEKLNEIINHIPNKYRNSQYLDYISKQSFKQLALIKIFNKANNAFSFNVIPEEVIDDFILINILAKKKANIENNLHFFPNEQNVSFEDVYLKMKNSYQKHSFLAQFETTISFKEKENERFQKREFSEKLMKNEKQIYTKETIEYHDGNIESEMIPLETDNSRFNISNSPENISKEIQPNETEINNINDQQISSDKIIDSNEFEGTNEAITPLNTNGIRQDDSYTPDNILKDIPLDKTEEDIPLDKTEEDIPLNNTEEDIPLNKTEENIHLNNTEEDIPLNNTEEDIPLNKTEEDIPLNNTEEDIHLDKTEEDIHLGKTEEEGIHLDKTEQEDIHLDKLKSSDFKDSNEVEEGKEDTISLETYGTKLYYSNSPENTIKETRSSEVEKDMLNKQQTSSDTIIDTSQFEKINEEINEEESIPDNTRSNDIDTQEYYVIGSHLDKTEENVNNNENNTSTASIEKLNSAIQPNQDNLEEVHKENQINAAILDRYQLIIQNVEHFFKTLYNTGYGHFGQIAKELGINPQTIDVAFYSSTAAVIICFQHLPDEGSYTKYQNLLLTLSNLFRSFNINMVRPLKQQEINNTDLSMGNPVKQTLLTLETIFASYLKNIDISDFLNVLELRCSFDYWLLTNNDCEIPMDLLPPSKFSQYDFEIASSLKDQSELSIETKPRINDFIHLFTYLNIYDGYDKRIVVDEWTKPEIGNILNALLNFGFNSASSADFIAKTYIITKSIGNISSCIGEILKILKSEPNVENNSFKGIDDEVFKTINFNTDIYEKIGVIVNNPSNYSLTEIEIEFLIIILKFGIQSFNDIFSDSRYDFKDKLPMFGNFEMFTNRISEVIERSK